MLVPYIPSSYTYEFEELMQAVGVTQQFIAVKLGEVLAIIVERGAQASPEVKTDIESRLRSLAESYFEISEQQVRIKPCRAGH